MKQSENKCLYFSCSALKRTWWEFSTLLRWSMQSLQAITREEKQVLHQNYFAENYSMRWHLRSCKFPLWSGKQAVPCIHIRSIFTFGVFHKIKPAAILSSRTSAFIKSAAMLDFNINNIVPLSSIPQQVYSVPNICAYCIPSTRGSQTHNQTCSISSHASGYT